MIIRQTLTSGSIYFLYQCIKHIQGGFFDWSCPKSVEDGNIPTKKVKIKVSQRNLPWTFTFLEGFCHLQHLELLGWDHPVWRGKSWTHPSRVSSTLRASSFSILHLVTFNWLISEFLAFLLSTLHHFRISGEFNYAIGELNNFSD